MFFGPVASVPILLFSGFFVNFNTIPGYLQWVPYVSYIRYGFEGAMISIYGYGREKLSCSEAYCHFRNPMKFLEEMDMATAQYWIDAAALAGFFLVLRFVAYFVLRLKLRLKKWRRQIRGQSCSTMQLSLLLDRCVNMTLRRSYSSCVDNLLW